MRQYLDVKDKHPDAIVLFRLGDFYEMFFEDAVVGARLLDLTLTTRDKGKDDAVPMCGVPHHAARGYIAKLTDLGRRVVIVEQVEDPKLAKGLVKREVARIVTPGIVLDDEVLEPKLPRYLAALVPDEKDKSTLGLAYLEATTGELRATELSITEIVDELARVAPREVLCDAKYLRDTGVLAAIRTRTAAGAPYRVAWHAAPVPSYDGAIDILDRIATTCERSLAPRGTDHAAAVDRIATTTSSRASGMATPSPIAQDVHDLAGPLALRAAATVLAYARTTQPTGTLPVVRLLAYRTGDAVVLDEAAIANLELVETLIGRTRQGSLLEVIDETVTAPGGRLLRRWLLYPLVDVAHVRRRQDAVAWLVARPAITEQLRRALSRSADLERLAGKATLGVATPRDLGRLRDALAQLPELVAIVRSAATPLDPTPALLELAAAQAPALAELATRLGAALVDDPPALLRTTGTNASGASTGAAIRDGYDAQIDECRRLTDGGKHEILAIEEREQKLSGIANLKIRYNRVFGYYIEITKSQLAKVPEHYSRKQTVATGERYVTPELAELERKVVAAEDTLAQREAELFRIEVKAVAALAPMISAAGGALAIADAVASLAEVAARRGYVRPTVDAGHVLDIVDGRHPVIEAMLPAGSFVPNDCRLDPDDAQLVLVTGPNMAGKSTYMRQVAQIALLAQIGSFVPAKAATVGICDRVFTRVGAADNLSRGDSTFMVEMRETATILANATRRSLIVLDEVGRGTSTFDGVSIAWAVAEHLHDAIGARTLFATHYHELVALASSDSGRPRVRNVSMAVREHKGEIVFLRRVVPGGASKSYGVDVARLAGLPKSVIGRAREIMAKLEGGAKLGSSAQLALPVAVARSPVIEELIEKLASIDVDRTTPLEALRILVELKSLT